MLIILLVRLTLSEHVIVDLAAAKLFNKLAPPPILCFKYIPSICGFLL